MSKNDKNNSSESEEDDIDYQHTASEIDALRAILEKREKDKNAESFDKDENENHSEETGSRSDGEKE